MQRPEVCPGKLEGKKAIVTGGDSGIGRAICVAYAREGADVAINFIQGDEKDGQETKKMVEETGRKAVLIEGDVGEEEHVKQMIDTVKNEFGKIDILVNNAGVEHVAPLEQFDIELWNRIFKTNITGHFLMTKYSLPLMPDGSRIIATSSIQGIEGMKDDAPYSATKGAIIAFTKSLAYSLLDRRILCNVVAPGPVETPMLKSEHPEVLKMHGGKMFPLGVAKPEQIAETYVFLASDDAAYYNAAVLEVTGGGHVIAA